MSLSSGRSQALIPPFAALATLPAILSRVDMVKALFLGYAMCTWDVLGALFAVAILSNPYFSLFRYCSPPFVSVHLQKGASTNFCCRQFSKANRELEAQGV